MPSIKELEKQRNVLRKKHSIYEKKKALKGEIFRLKYDKPLGYLKSSMSALGKGAKYLGKQAVRYGEYYQRNEKSSRPMKSNKNKGLSGYSSGSIF